MRSRANSTDDQDGIAPATTGWTTITLPVGRYELARNAGAIWLACVRNSTLSPNPTSR